MNDEQRLIYRKIIRYSKGKRVNLHGVLNIETLDAIIIETEKVDSYSTVDLFKSKVSGCFRTELYAKAYCRISSYLQTMAKGKGYNPLIVIGIQMAMKGEFV